MGRKKTAYRGIKMTYKDELLQDLHALLEIGVNTKKAIKKVKSGFFDKDIAEYERNGADIEDLSDYIQMF